MEREQLDSESKLVVTVTASETFREDVSDRIGALDRGETDDTPPKLSFGSYDDMMTTLTPRVLDLIETVRREEPTSINETARVVERDVKNVHEELNRLARLGVIYFEENGQSKRPVVWFDELVISLPFESSADSTQSAAP